MAYGTFASNRLATTLKTCLEELGSAAYEILMNGKEPFLVSCSEVHDFVA
jgi:hypothetical protein